MKYVKYGLIILVAFVVILVGMFTTAVLWPLDVAVPVKTDSPIVIKDVAIVDVKSGVVIPDQTVIIDRQRIIAIGFEADLLLPANAKIIDGNHRFLAPALWDMHTHVLKISPLMDLSLYIRYGVTNVRDMMSCPLSGDPFIACPDDQRRWTDEATAGNRVGPRVVGTTSFHANGPSILDRINGIPKFFGTETAEQARAFVRHYAGKVDAIKVYNNVSREAYLALTDEAKIQGLDVVGHRPRGVSAIEAAANQKSIEHARFILHESYPGSEGMRKVAGTSQWQEDRRSMIDEHDPKMAAAIFSAMKASGTWYVPTHLTRREDAFADDPLIRENPLLRYVHPLMKWQWLEDVDGLINEDPSPEARATYREFYRKGLELTGAAHRAGVKVLVGTDYIVAGATVHEELQQLVMAGLSPVDALRAATISSAEYFGLENEYGQVAEGMVADLILLNQNPLEDIRHTLSIEAVIFNGNLYDLDALEGISNHVQHQAKSWTVACKIIWGFLKSPVAY